MCVLVCFFECVTVRGVDTHLRNWSNARNDNVLCVYGLYTGEGRENLTRYHLAYLAGRRKIMHYFSLDRNNR